MDRLESEAEMKKRKKEEHTRLLQERRNLLQQQEREKQERDDRKLAEKLAIKDAQQAGLFHDPRCIVKPYSKVISRGASVGLGFGNQGNNDISGELDAFGGISNFRGPCASSIASTDEVVDSSKMTSGCSGDVRVLE